MVAAQIRFSSRMRPDQKSRVARQSSMFVGRAKDQNTPDQKPEEEANLPKTSKLNVREALIAEPKPSALDVAHDA